MNEDKPEPKKGALLPALRSVGIDANKTALKQMGALATASAGSISVSGDNLGSIVNISAHSVILEPQIARELPSYLSKVVARFSEDLSEYNAGPKRLLPPEVDVKLAYNDFPPSHHIITDYSKYSNVLEATYRGVEQRNDDARRLVRRRASVAYADELHKLCKAHSVEHVHAHDFARLNAVPLVMAVVAALISDFSTGSTTHVMQETAHLAICLIVADAVIECDVLESPANAIAS
jgi:hypothetical protein